MIGWIDRKDAEKVKDALEDGRVFELIDGTFAAAGPVFFPLEGGRDRVVYGPDGQVCSSFGVTLLSDMVISTHG